MFQSWTQTVATAPAAGSAVANTTSNTTLLPSTALYTFPANFFSYIGQSWELHAMGSLTTTSGSNTATLNFQFGSVVVCTAAIALVASVGTAATWSWDAYGTVRALGSGTSTNNIYWSVFHSSAVVGTTQSTPNTGDEIFPYQSPAVSSGWDCTATQQANLYVTWSAANSSNSIICQAYILKALN